jgi:hypothetical protein
LNDGLAWIPVFVSAPSDGKEYPTVSGFWLDSGAENAGLRVGDQLTRVGAADLQGVGPFGFVVRVYETVNAELQFAVSFMREASPREATLTLRRIGFPWRMLPLSLGFASTAVLALLRAPSPRLARMFFLASMTYSLYWTYCFGGGPPTLTYSWAAVFSFASFFMFPLWVRTILLFSEEIAPTGARLPFWPWLFLIYGLAMTSMAFGTPYSHMIGLQANFILNAMFAATMLVVLVRSFRRVDPIGSRQLKWVVYGIYLSTAPVFLADVVTMFNPAWIRLHEIATLSLICVPVCLFIAIVRFNLLDIDRLISVTVAYTILLIVLVGGVLVAIPRLSLAASSAFGIEPASGQLIGSLVLIALVLPGQHSVRRQIERMFFAERYGLEQGIRQLLLALSNCRTSEILFSMVGERCHALLQPENCVVYRRDGDHYAPVFVRGGVIPAVFTVESPLVGALQTKTSQTDTVRWGRAVRAQLSATDRDVLDRMQAEVVLPMGRQDPPTAFLCLGVKRSTDVYTATDLTLLREVIEKASEELLRFAESESPPPMEIRL